MTVFNSNVRSLINGLSDFWLTYFKDQDTLRALMEGVEIEVGQSYLDFLSLILNGSVKDTTVFNKEYFKHLFIREDQLQFKAGTTSADDRYYFNLPDNVVNVDLLNNKLFNVTSALEKNIDFFVGDTGEVARLEFVNDPTNAYRELVFGSNISAFRVRSKLLGEEQDEIRVYLNDNGGPFAIIRTQFDITVDYDGPANTGTTTSKSIVQSLNVNSQVNELILAELLESGGGNESPVGNSGLEYLKRADKNALDGFAKRSVEVAFGGKFSVNTITNWVDEGVQKGDILRLLGGAPKEFDIDVIRPTALYTNIGYPIPVASAGKVDFIVLREPEDNISSNEAFNDSGLVTQSNSDGEINATLRRFTAPSANFANIYIDDVILLVGANNNEGFRILNRVNSTTVELAGSGFVNELGLLWSLYTVLDPVNIGTDGTLSGTSFSSVTATFTATDAPGTVLRVYRAGRVEHYDILEYVSATEVVLSVAPGDGVGLEWGWARRKTPTQQLIFSPPIGVPRSGSVEILARRLVDSAAVQEGRDYEVNVDTGRVRPITVWRTSLRNTITYKYALAIVSNTVPLQNGLDGTITPGSPNVFSSATAAFTIKHVGYAISINGSALTAPTNNGIHYIANVLSSTSVELTSDKIIPTTVDIANGNLSWSLLRRGSTEIENITTQVTELSFWAPDILVDRFHLYNSYGYLINVFERSSEAYRSLIRGIFQLFMLGPTLERFESAINTVAGIPVIRDEGEVLRSYSSGSVQEGNDGFFLSTKVFTAASASFTALNVGQFIYAVGGNNVNKLFTIVTVLGPTSVTLNEVPISDGPVEWELNNGAPQAVTTSRTIYEFDRRLVLRTPIKDPANFGLLTFRAFEVLTEAFNVTDYVESPRWWEFAQIPEVLLPNESSSRRQSTPNLFENVINPSDEGRIGDPGFIIGADSEGFIPPSDLLRDDAGAGDGVLIGDPSYPFSNRVFFESPTGAFTNADRFNVLRITQGDFRILDITSATRVQLEVFRDYEDASGLTWELRSGAIAKRHKAAFIIIDKYLKYHTFLVEFDISLRDLYPSDLLQSLEELVLIAKPTYTYILISPFALFQEILNVEEEFNHEQTLGLGGSGGEQIIVNDNPLLVIGASWKIGTWFRYLENTSTFNAPIATLTDPLGTPDVGYAHHVSKFVVDHATFTAGGVPIQIAKRIPKIIFTSPIGDGSVDTNVVMSAAGLFQEAFVMAQITITGSGLGNNGTYRIGARPSANELSIDAPGLVSESGIEWYITSVGDFQGTLKVGIGGVATFTESSGNSILESPLHVGDYIRRPFVGGFVGTEQSGDDGNFDAGTNTFIAASANFDASHVNQTLKGLSGLNEGTTFIIMEVNSSMQVTLNKTPVTESLVDWELDTIKPKNTDAYRLDSFNGTSWNLYQVTRVEPLATEPDAAGSLVSGVLTVLPNVILFSPSMAQNDRYSEDPDTYLFTRFQIVFTSGPNSGTTADIMTFLDTENVKLSGVLADDAAVTFYLQHRVSYNVSTETTDWEHVRELIQVADTTIDFSNATGQDVVAGIAYTAWGVREPLDPLSASFDDSLGDTMYHVGMPDPKQLRGKGRTGLETDLREDPIQITRT